MENSSNSIYGIKDISTLEAGWRQVCVHFDAVSMLFAPGLRGNRLLRGFSGLLKRGTLTCPFLAFQHAVSASARAVARRSRSRTAARAARIGGLALPAALRTLPAARARTARTRGALAAHRPCLSGALRTTLRTSRRADQHPDGRRSRDCRSSLRPRDCRWVRGRRHGHRSRRRSRR